MSDRTLEVHKIPELPLDGRAEVLTTPEERLLSGLEDAIDLASDQGTVTWLTDHGKRIAAIVPVDFVEAERKRLYAEIGNDHWVVFTEDGWSTEHSIQCRLSGHMHECEYHTAVGRMIAEHGPPPPGRVKILSLTDGGLSLGS